ncbi:uncharacterized protein LOC142349012 [Convolutriloba macropyga]|uniref:uncharacterized protein LOC142349012 n=1 Tax=Convolutriloba macropyga TaxID=536237 RepID=UPI003F5269BD
MSDFLTHLKDTNWIDLNAWVCACLCPCYVFSKVAYFKLKEDSYRLPVASICPCVLAFWYMSALDRIPDSLVNKVLACCWTGCCPTCAVYVAAADDGMKVVEESKACIELVKKVVTIDRV